MVHISKGILANNLKELKRVLEELKAEILADDRRYELAIKERKMMEIISK